METLSNITVEYRRDISCIYMTWQKWPLHSEVYQAYAETMRYLEAADKPLSLIVDIRSKPVFPISATINGALHGPYKHPMLKEWIFLGVSPVARVIERTLRSVTGRSNVLWFDTTEAIMGYLEAQSA